MGDRDIGRLMRELEIDNAVDLNGIESKSLELLANVFGAILLKKCWCRNLLDCNRLLNDVRRNR